MSVFGEYLRRIDGLRKIIVYGSLTESANRCYEMSIIISKGIFYGSTNAYKMNVKELICRRKNDYG